METIVSSNTLNHLDIGGVVGEIGPEYPVIAVLNREISDVISIIVTSRKN